MTEFISPLGHTDIEELIALLAALSQARLVSPSKAMIDGPHGSGTIQGWALAQGIELVRWDSYLKQPFRIQRTPELNDPVWTILLTDSSRLIANKSESEAHQAPTEGMAYLYNHHLAMNLMFEDTGPIRMLLIRFKPQAWQFLNPRPDIATQFIDANEPRFYGFSLQGKLAQLFTQLFYGSVEATPAPWQNLNTTLEVCSQLFENLQQRPQTTYAKLNSRDAHRIHQAQQLLIADFQEPKNLAEICKQVGLGRDKLRQLFQQVYGTTPYQYFQEQRLQEAHRLIAQEHFSVMEAGYRVGYSHMGHFSQAFRKQFGYLPKAVKAAT
jgi:AraC-like DNA-binding protein